MIGSRMMAAISPGFCWKRSSTAGEVVEGGNDNIGETGFRHAESAGYGCRRMDIAVIWSVRLHTYQGGIVQAVVAAFELDDLVAAGGGAGETNRVHGGFGAAVAEADHFHGKALADFLGQLPLHVMRHAKHGAGGQTFPHGFHDGGMAVSRHERAEAEVVINVVVAVEIAEVRSLALFDEDGIGIVGAIVAGHTQRDAFQVALVGLGGLGRAALEGFELAFEICVHRDSPENSSRSWGGH